MAERTLQSGYFGSVGMGDPMSSFVERTLAVSFDFGKKPVTNNVSGGAVKNIPLIEIPKGFCIDRISVVQTAKLNSAMTATFGLASDDTKTVGGNFALSATDTLLRSSQAAKSDVVTKTANNVYVSTGTTWTASDGMKLVTDVTGGGDGSLFVDGDVLCLVVPTAADSTAVTFNEGAFDLCIHGFETFSEGVGGNKLARGNYRDTLQSGDQSNANVSGGLWPLD